MKRLWIADVHANLPAFEAVLADAGEVDEIVFLGDIVGFGPHPSECVDLLQQLGARSVMGNHDLAVLALEPRPASKDGPIDWNRWTRDRLTPAQLAFLSSLPTDFPIDFCGTTARVMHHLPEAPYLHPAMPDSVLAPYIQTVPDRIVVCGHSHRAIDREVDGRRYVCIPPAGQPRNGDTRAGYALEDRATLTFHFVPYDIEQVVAGVQNIGLAAGFSERWTRFLRTAFDAEWSREYSDGQ